jgi:hypothetical protein
LSEKCPTTCAIGKTKPANPSYLAGIENQVEAQFLRPTLLGESILPYRVFRPFEAVIPLSEDGKVLDARGALAHGYDKLAAWMRKAEAVWDSNNNTTGLLLTGQFDYYGKLAAQFPPAELRIVYSKAGTQPAACIVNDASAVIDHKLYWTVPSTPEEGQYLCAVVNSETARSRAAAYQSRGQWGARDFDKVIFNLPIPRFDAEIKLHRDLATAAERAEAIAGAIVLPEAVKFQRARGMVRDALAEAGVSNTIDALVSKLLDGN